MKIPEMKPSAPLWIGAGLTILMPVIAPGVRAAAKNISKAMIIGGMRTYSMFKAASFAVAENLVELYEEARAELDEQDT